MPAASARAVVDFWLTAGFERWFTRDEDFDAEIAQRLRAEQEAAAAGARADWAESPEGSLALLVLLDQVPRNLYRGTPRAYASDAQALMLAKDAVARGLDAAYGDPARLIFYLPFTHSELLADQDRCVALCRRAALDIALPSALEHRDIVARFGRFPHRNAILGRASTEAEQQFLDEGGFAG